MAHKDRKEKAERRKAQQAELFESSASALYAKLGGMLIGVPGIKLSTPSVHFLETTSPIETLRIEMLGKEVTFNPVERNEVRGLDVSGLFDRALFFTPFESGNWEAEDQRNNATILLTENLIFTRLVAIIPD